MAIYITGDTHGGINDMKLKSKYFPNYENVTKDDILIILGDFGYIHAPEYREDLKEKEYNKMIHTFKNRKWGTVLFIDGNHENFDRLNKYPEIDMFGGKVGEITEGIYHLKRGYIYNIQGYKIFTFGGANSVAKHTLTDGVDWWKEEKFNLEESNRAFDNLEKHNCNVDLILSHTCSTTALKYLSEYYKRTMYPPDEFNRLFEEFKYRVNYKKWLFGHHHLDLELRDNEVAVFKDFYKLESKCDNNEFNIEKLEGYDLHQNKWYD